MSGPAATTSITITLLSTASAGPFTLTIPTAFATLQGLGAADTFIRDIFVRGGFWADDGKFYPVSLIQNIATA